MSDIPSYILEQLKVQSLNVVPQSIVLVQYPATMDCHWLHEVSKGMEKIREKYPDVFTRDVAIILTPDCLKFSVLPVDTTKWQEAEAQINEQG